MSYLGRSLGGRTEHSGIYRPSGRSSESGSPVTSLSDSSVPRCRRIPACMPHSCAAVERISIMKLESMVEMIIEVVSSYEGPSVSVAPNETTKLGTVFSRLSSRSMASTSLRCRLPLYT
ncbi:hypothetical protein CIHG_02744 [Coccidioides immitis H538.4]|nr:hypothetical protein CIHG_02744 [Coccidioides immitis H538.4]